MTKKYSMWIEDQPNGKYKFVKRYVDPLRSTEKHIVTKKVATTLTKKTAQAKREAEEILDKKIEKKVNTAAKGTDITLQELTDKYQEYLKVTSRPWNSRKRAAGNYKFINQYFKNAIAKNITPPMINKYLEYCLYKRKPRTLSNASTRLRLVYLSNAYKFGIRHGLLITDPTLKVNVQYKDESAKKRDRIENKYLTNEELKAILGYCKYVAGRIDYYYLFKWLSVTGMRISEAAGIQKKNIFEEDGLWYAQVNGNYEYHYGDLYHQEEEGKTHSSKTNHTKTNAGRRNVQLNDSALMIYNNLKDFRKEDEYLLKNTFFNSPWNSFTVNGYLKKIAKKLGINKPLTSHFFRHTLISKLSESNTPLAAIMAQVGQADSRITVEIYTHVTKKAKQRLNNDLNKIDLHI